MSAIAPADASAPSRWNQIRHSFVTNSSKIYPNLSTGYVISPQIAHNYMWFRSGPAFSTILGPQPFKRFSHGCTNYRGKCKLSTCLIIIFGTHQNFWGLTGSRWKNGDGFSPDRARHRGRPYIVDATRSSCRECPWGRIRKVLVAVRPPRPRCTRLKIIPEASLRIFITFTHKLINWRREAPKYYTQTILIIFYV